MSGVWLPWPGNRSAVLLIRRKYLWCGQLVGELEAAHSGAHEPMSMRTVERSLRDAWGVDPTDELDELDPEPAAVTPSAQVHRGVLGGDAVAVKVLRPGLAGSVRQDLVLL